jgi:hypothetical protein
LPYEENLTNDVIQAVGEVFTMGFYAYVNHDKVYSGLAVGLHGMPQTLAGTGIRTMVMDCSLSSFVEQCKELEERYRQLRRPLGPSFSETQQSVSASSGKKHNRKKKGRRNNKSSGTRICSSEIRSKVDLLLKTMEKCLSPSWATGYLLVHMAKMLEVAVNADMDIARVLLDKGEALLRLRKRALDFAVQADSDLTRPGQAADCWWQTFKAVTALAGNVVRVLIHGEGIWGVLTNCSGPDDEFLTADGEKAVQFYDKKLEPQLISSLESEIATEKLVAVTQLGWVLVALPRAYCVRLVKDRKRGGFWKALSTTPPAVVEN